MGQREILDALPTQPIYTQRTANEAIELGKVTASFPDLADEKNKTYDATVILDFSPTATLKFVVADPDSYGKMLSRVDLPATTLELGPSGKSIQVFCATGSMDTCTYIPTEHPIQLHPQITRIALATFHLINWPNIMGDEDYVLRSGSPPDNSFQTMGRVTLSADGWVIAITELENASDLVKAAKKSDGYAITHVGSIRRADGSEFATESLDDLLLCLLYFFSFAFGRWSGPSLTVGYDHSNARVFEHWGLNRTARGSWEGSHSWFDYQHAHLLAEVFPGFVALWKNETWRTTLIESIYWYIGANSGARTGGTAIGVDAALLLSQAALELLAWTYCIKHRRMISEHAFKQRGLYASDKLRLLATGLDIPLEIPSVLNILHSRKGAKWVDSMDAITDIRNGLVHPGTVRNQPDGASAAIWKLSLWYIELVLLRMCGHSGDYANRLARRWAGTVEPVPWKVLH